MCVLKRWPTGSFYSSTTSSTSSAVELMAILHASSPIGKSPRASDTVSPITTAISLRSCPARALQFHVVKQYLSTFKFILVIFALVIIYLLSGRLDRWNKLIHLVIATLATPRLW